MAETHLITAQTCALTLCVRDYSGRSRCWYGHRTGASTSPSGGMEWHHRLRQDVLALSLICCLARHARGVGRFPAAPFWEGRRLGRGVVRCAGAQYRYWRAMVYDRYAGGDWIAPTTTSCSYQVKRIPARGSCAVMTQTIAVYLPSSATSGCTGASAGASISTPQHHFDQGRVTSVSAVYSRKRLQQRVYRSSLRLARQTGYIA
jgi:hypothetical protein